MIIHSVYTQVFKIWRAKRMLRFESTICPQKTDIILDIGGFPSFWLSREQMVQRIECINLNPGQWNAEDHPDYQITMGAGDGCNLNYADLAYDISFSNSVIEHVGDWEAQEKFAKESRRVGKKIWMQTPAFECPLEPHYMAPFVHWLPVVIRRRVLRWFTPWGWMAKPDQKRVDETIFHTRLLKKKEVENLFPDCEIITERIFGIIPKSYIAYRLQPVEGQ